MWIGLSYFLIFILYKMDETEIHHMYMIIWKVLVSPPPKKKTWLLFYTVVNLFTRTDVNPFIFLFTNTAYYISRSIEINMTKIHVLTGQFRLCLASLQAKTESHEIMLRSCWLMAMVVNVKCCWCFLDAC